MRWKYTIVFRIYERNPNGLIKRTCDHSRIWISSLMWIKQIDERILWGKNKAVTKCFVRRSVLCKILLVLQQNFLGPLNYSTSQEMRLSFYSWINHIFQRLTQYLIVRKVLCVVVLAGGCFLKITSPRHMSKSFEIALDKSLPMMPTSAAIKSCSMIAFASSKKYFTYYIITWL